MKQSDTPRSTAAGARDVKSAAQGVTVRAKEGVQVRGTLSAVQAASIKSAIVLERQSGRFPKGVGHK